MLKAVVLSGGGSKGSYELGVWKALKKLKYEYNIVTGSSIGAVNGFFMVQKDYRKACKLWKELDFYKVYGKKIKLKEKTEVYKIYIKNFFRNNGMDTDSFYKVLNKYYNSKKFNSSDVNYGLIPYNLSKKKPEIKVKKELAENFTKYVLASCTCYPIFEITEIEGDKYLDGGYYDNLPINLAIDLGAEEIIAVDLKAIGFKKKVKNSNCNIKYITPKNDLGSIMIFSKEVSKKNIKYGYNETMKKMCKLDGDKYTFKKGNIIANYTRVNKKYVNKIKEIFKNSKIEYDFEKQFKSDTYNSINRTLEYLGEILKIDDTKIYNIKKYNKLIKQKFKKIKIKDTSLKRATSKELLIKNIYEDIKLNNSKNINIYLKFFKKEFLCAIYLLVI